ncbi:MAG: hypothetical protein M3005_04365 [Apilactobacillus sp.]|uniref:aggregation-promoting factor C-terminal-like domain-containing protein n=1 Tax=Apilactobacillus apinorum TaxID=1218495 RepID=UPI0025DC9D43|nr:hypothetical protein [Apilactobacillus sp.]MCT6823092.1 hypothetical protein [Apilactobacillus sp.]MCT6858293.1 hypothetical protein [Apilactobacillus sp.]
MHSNNKMITFTVLVSLLIATLFLLPHIKANADVVASQQNVTSTTQNNIQETANTQTTNVNKVKKHGKKILSSTKIKKHSSSKLHKRLSAANSAAKAFIANHESGGSYTASNGTCYGKYQLAISYYHGNFSHKNQERLADKYVKSRYGSWVAAKAFWLAHSWY